MASFRCSKDGSTQTYAAFAGYTSVNSHAAMCVNSIFQAYVNKCI